MHIFITGGSGLTGPAIVAELIAAGHAVTGLARSDEAAAKLQALGAEAHRGSLDDLDSLRAGAEAADGVIHMAFGGSFADPDDLARSSVVRLAPTVHGPGDYGFIPMLIAAARRTGVSAYSDSTTTAPAT